MNWGTKLLAILLMLICTQCGKNPGERPLARFDGGQVIQNDYINHYLLSTKYKPDKMPTIDNLKEIVTLKALETISALEARKMGLEQDSTYKIASEKNENRLIFYRYMRKEIIDPIITDSLVMKFYQEFSPQYRMRYILRPVIETSTDEFAQSQKDTIEYVYKQLQKGKSFEEMAKKHSQDISTNKKGGDLGFVIRESMGDAVLRAVMDTLNDFSYSKPFRGFAGYYIMYKGEKREVPIPVLSQVRQRIWNTLFHSRQHLVRMEVEKRFTKYADEYGYRINQDVVDQIMHKAGWTAKKVPDSILDFSRLEPDDMDQTVARFNAGEIAVGEIFAQAKKAPDNKRDFEKRLNSIAQQQILAQHARKLGLQNEPDLKKQISEMKSSLLSTLIYKKEVKEKAQEKINAMLAESKNKSSNDEITKKQFQFEKELKDAFEEKLKTTYKFAFIIENFSDALAEATKQKELQNQERSGTKIPVRSE